MTFVAATDRPSPWHPGELDAQRRAGVDPAHIAAVTGFLRTYLNDQHRAFYPRLPFIVVGAVDQTGSPWATLLEGQPGFMDAVDESHLRIAARPDADDPAAAGLSAGNAVGLLGIELETRRRNRLNGHVRGTQDGTLLVEVDRAYGNCPKYIHTRELRDDRDAASASVAIERLASLDAEARDMITRSGTFFVASSTESPERAVDVSHRGGRPGFVKVDGDWLTIPDFAGNQFFNTLGNFLVNPKAGLLFPDFISGDVLQLSGAVEVLFDSSRLADFEGAQRLWRVHVQQVVRRRGALRWRGVVRDESAEADITGTWAEAGARERSAAARGWRSLRVVRVQDEAQDVRSFTLQPVDADRFSPGDAGMHLVLRLPPPPGGPSTVVSYSLSRMPSDGGYRISVKRAGVRSNAVWAHLTEGAVVAARGPQGDFVAQLDSPRPVVLLSAGIGITPMLAMAEQLLDADRRAERPRRIHFLHGAQDGEAMPFGEELAALASACDGLFTITRCFSQPRPADRPGTDFEIHGRLDVATLRRALPFDDYDFYLCGPPNFMQRTYDDLRAMNIADDRIRAEAFGLSSLRRGTSSAGVASPVDVGPAAATVEVQVTFARSQINATWTPGSGSLLELAERAGLTPEFGCRNGTCGTCRVDVVAGGVAYPGRNAPAVAANGALICCGVPAQVAGGESESRLELDL